MEKVVQLAPCYRIKHMVTAPNRLFGLVRIKQWPKNALVAAAPIVSGAIPDSREIVQIVFGVLSFTMVSSIVYIINDLKDSQIDKHHSTKRFRPIAAGTVSRKEAIFVLLLLVLVSTGFLLQVNENFFIVISIYFFLNILYTFKLKNIPIVELLIVSSGFFLRTLSGAYILDIPISEWFLLVTSFGSLYIVSVKRLTEKKSESVTSARAVLEKYSMDFLLIVVGMSLTITLTSYGMWSFGREISDAYTGLSMFTLLFALMRYFLSAEKGKVESPEDLIFNDKSILISLVLTLSFVLASIYF